MQLYTVRNSRRLDPFYTDGPYEVMIGYPTLHLVSKIKLPSPIGGCFEEDNLMMMAYKTFFLLGKES